MVLIELMYWKMVLGEFMFALLDNSTIKSERVSEEAGSEDTRILAQKELNTFQCRFMEALVPAEKALLRTPVSCFLRLHISVEQCRSR